VKALVLKGAMSLTRDGKTETYKAGQTFSMPARLHALRELRRWRDRHPGRAQALI